MAAQQPQPVAVLMLTAEQLKALIVEAVSTAQSANDDRPLTQRDAAEFLSISEKTLKAKVLRGEITPLPGRPFRFLRSQLIRSK